MNRHIVYTLIDEERDRQDILGEDRTDGRHHNVGEELVLMNVYLRKAFEAWANNPGDDAAIARILQIGALAVRALEKNS